MSIDPGINPDTPCDKCQPLFIRLITAASERAFEKRTQTERLRAERDALRSVVTVVNITPEGYAAVDRALLHLDEQLPHVAATARRLLIDNDGDAK